MYRPTGVRAEADVPVERVEAMRRRLVELAVAIRREQLRAELGPLEHTPESCRLEKLYHRLQPAYARELDYLESEDRRTF